MIINKHVLLSFFLLILSAPLAAQQIAFERVIPPSPTPQIVADFTSYNAGPNTKISYVDIDNDNDLDVVFNAIGIPNISRLYLNDGLGNFEEGYLFRFDGRNYINPVFGDVNNDGYDDILLLYDETITNSQGKLYLSDGHGNYTLTNNNNFLYNSQAFFTDIDGDNDLDLYMIGLVDYSDLHASVHVFENDGSGNFTEVNGVFPDYYLSITSIKFFDADGDHDLDILQQGTDRNTGQSYVKLYNNTGNYNYIENTSAVFENLYVNNGNQTVTADIDNDGDNDIILSGDNQTIIYMNNGSGTFTIMSNNLIQLQTNSAISLADVDNDNDLDMLLAGNTTNGIKTKLYLNDGNGIFTESISNNFVQVKNANIEFSDVDNDGDQDVIIVGGTNHVQATNILYINDGTGVFYEVKATPFDGVEESSVAFADIDNDGDKDVFITGLNRYNKPLAEFYTNDGTGNYTLVQGTNIPGVYNSSVAFSNANNAENYQLLLVAGRGERSVYSSLYTNRGNGVFSLVRSASFVTVTNPNVAFFDYDNDHDQDIVITGTSYGQSLPALYKRTAIYHYTIQTRQPFIDVVSDACIAHADVNGDGLEDLLFVDDDYTSSNIIDTHLYMSNPNGIFTENTNYTFPEFAKPVAVFVDVDGDNDQDIVITGRMYINNNTSNITKIFINDGSGNFSERANTNLPGVYNGSMAVADVDLDGDMDLLITGFTNHMGNNIIKLFENDGAGNFTEVANMPFDPVWESSVAFEDIDNDGDPDLLITGQNNNRAPIAKLYRNVTQTSAINRYKKMNVLTIYPNPSNGTFFIKEKYIKATKIRIFNMQGQEVATCKILNNKFTTDLRNGMYIGYIFSSNNEDYIIKKIIIK